VVPQRASPAQELLDQESGLIGGGERPVGGRGDDDEHAAAAEGDQRLDAIDPGRPLVVAAAKSEASDGLSYPGAFCIATLPGLSLRRALGARRASPSATCWASPTARPDLPRRQPCSGRTAPSTARRPRSARPA
jgi:hypothetical protein